MINLFSHKALYVNGVEVFGVSAHEKSHYMGVKYNQQILLPYLEGLTIY